MQPIIKQTSLQFPVDTIDFARPSYDSQVTWITPEYAGQLLLERGANRNPSTTHVETLSRLIVAGKFVLSDDPLAFDTKGRVRNAQHRLFAIARAGQPVLMKVTVNKTEAECEVYDRNRTRSHGDILMMRGVSKGKRISAIQGILLYLEGDGAHVGTYTDAEKDDVGNRYGVSIRAILSTFEGQISGFDIAPVVGAMAFGHARYPEKIGEFSRQYATGLGLENGAPARALRDSITTQRGTTGFSAQFHRSVATIHTLAAMKYHVDGKPLVKAVPVRDTSMGECKYVQFFLQAPAVVTGP